LTEAVRRPLFYLVDWLPPDFGATGQYALIACINAAKAGRRVHIIGLTTGIGSKTRETFPGGGDLTTTRIHASPVTKTDYLARMLWSLITGFRLIWTFSASNGARGADLIFTGSPPFMVYFAVAAKYLLALRLTYRITDFYPEVVIAALPRRAWILERLQALTWVMRRRVDTFEVLGEDQRRLLVAGRIPVDRVTLVRDGSPVTITGRETRLPPPAALADRLILLYSGNYGVAHEVDTVYAGLLHHHRVGSNRFGLWLNGSGTGADRLERDLRAADAPVARTASLPLGDLARLLVTADAHLITLRPGFAGLVLPSKVYGCLASGRPIIFVGPEDSDVHLLCSQAAGQIYHRVDPGDAKSLDRALEAVADTAPLRSLTSKS
jgi:hypothetical protein